MATSILRVRPIVSSVIGVRPGGRLPMTVPVAGEATVRRMFGSGKGAGR
jgi:hypothetical protein